jgi:hypothetical protein
MHETLIRLFFLAHVAATVYMTGLIWFVQIVHYPLFARVGDAGFSTYEQRHTVLTTWVVGPPMLVEGITALILFWLQPGGVSGTQLWLGVALLTVIWISTAVVQVPCHEVLSQGFDKAAHQRLVWTNWIRTVAWSSRALLVLWMAWATLQDAGEPVLGHR